MPEVLVLKNHRMATVTTILDIRTIAVRVALRVASRSTQVLDARSRHFTEPFQKHGFDGCDVPLGFRVVA